MTPSTTSSRYTEEAREHAHPRADRAALKLTRAQTELMKMIAQGYSNIEIARRRGVTVSAIEQLATSVYKAFDIKVTHGISARVEAARLYIQDYGLPARD